MQRMKRYGSVCEMYAQQWDRLVVITSRNSETVFPNDGYFTDLINLHTNENSLHIEWKYSLNKIEYLYLLYFTEWKIYLKF